MSDAATTETPTERHRFYEDVFAMLLGTLLVSIGIVLYTKATLLTSGKVLFAGGITGSRGHVGDNDSLSILTAMILTSPSNRHPVTRFTYGCPIYSDADGLTADLQR